MLKANIRWPYFCDKIQGHFFFFFFVILFSLWFFLCDRMIVKCNNQNNHKKKYLLKKLTNNRNILYIIHSLFLLYFPHRHTSRIKKELEIVEGCCVWGLYQQPGGSDQEPSPPRGLTQGPLTILIIFIRLKSLPFVFAVFSFLFLVASNGDNNSTPGSRW